ncbi:MAG TPA: AraC family transcriptional regulator [Rudaea sp.]|nr:AraC family transcriptional regulator [Rudaea sp.]
MDRLDALLKRFSVSARMFHSGALCGINDIDTANGCGQLHLIKRGPLRVEHGARRAIEIGDASLLFYPRPHAHRLVTDAEVGADMACAHVAFSAGAENPIARALPSFVALPLAEIDGAEPVLDRLFAEAFGHACGRQAIVDRLFEVVLVYILRALMNGARVDQGLLAGMAHPQLAKALVAMHETPSRDWSLERLANQAGMSRSAFAAAFRDVVGDTPGDYLARYRVSVAQDLLRRGQPLARVASDVGYGSATALSRVFKAVNGATVREWRRQTEPA